MNYKKKLSNCPISLRIKRDLFRLTVNICILLFIYSLAISLLLSIYFDFFPKKINPNNKVVKRRTINLEAKKIDSKVLYTSLNYETDCYFESDACFNLYRCLQLKNKDTSGLKTKLKVYIYDNPLRGSNSEIVSTSKEFKEFIETILESDFYESNPSRACIFVPFVDLLNEASLISSHVEEYLHNLDL